MNNLASIEIPDALAKEVLALYDQIDTKMAPYMIVINDKDKEGLLKMGDKTISFVQKVDGYTDSAPDVVPAYLNKAEFKKDVKAVAILDTIYQRGLQTTQKIADTRTVVGSEAFTAALMFYGYTKELARNGIANAKTIYEDLSKRFSGRPSK